MRSPKRPAEDPTARRLADRAIVLDGGALATLARPDLRTRLAAWLRFGGGAGLMSLPGVRRAAALLARVALRARGGR